VFQFARARQFSLATGKPYLRPTAASHTHYRDVRGPDGAGKDPTCVPGESFYPGEWTIGKEEILGEIAVRYLGWLPGCARECGGGGRGMRRVCRQRNGGQALEHGGPHGHRLTDLDGDRRVATGD
jgi:hypothetical protein